MAVDLIPFTIEAEDLAGRRMVLHANAETLEIARDSPPHYLAIPRADPAAILNWTLLNYHKPTLIARSQRTRPPIVVRVQRSDAVRLLNYLGAPGPQHLRWALRAKASWLGGFILVLAVAYAPTLGVEGLVSLAVASATLFQIIKRYPYRAWFMVFAICSAALGVSLLVLSLRHANLLGVLGAIAIVPPLVFANLRSYFSEFRFSQRPHTPPEDAA